MYVNTAGGAAFLLSIASLISFAYTNYTFGALGARH